MKKRLTTRDVESLQPPLGGVAEVSDLLVIGLQIRATGSKKTWAYRYRFAGQHRRLKLGTYPATSLKKAIELANGAKGEVEQKKDPSVRNDSISVLEASKRYLMAKNGNRSINQYRGILELYLIPKLGRRSVSEIQTRDIYRIVEELMNSGKAYQSNRVLAVLKAFFNWAKQAGEIQDSPAQNIKRLSEEKPRERVLTGNELVQVLKAADEMGELLGALIKILVLTGQRREEVTQARWEEIDLMEGLWTIPAARTKNGQPHEIPLARASVDFLESLPRKSSEFLFPGRFGDRPFNGWSRASQRLLAVANLKTPWIIHDLRRTFATGCGELDVNPFIIKRLLNHSLRREMGVTSIYERSQRRDATRMAVEKWAQHVETLTHGQTSKVIRLPA